MHNALHLNIQMSAVRIKLSSMVILIRNNFYKLRVHLNCFSCLRFRLGGGFVCFVWDLLALIPLQFPICFISSSNFWLGDGIIIFVGFSAQLSFRSEN